jgi:hypothetical protein
MPDVVLARGLVHVDARLHTLHLRNNLLDLIEWMLEKKSFCACSVSSSVDSRKMNNESFDLESELGLASVCMLVS